MTIRIRRFSGFKRPSAQLDLTTGSIFSQLMKLALPIMATSFVQMAYNLIDMMWLGHVGSGAVAAVGTAGFFTWFGISLLQTAKVGGEVTVAQAAGRKDENEMHLFARNDILFALTFAIFYGLLLFVFAPQLISFFRLGTNEHGYNVATEAIRYLRVISCGVMFGLVNPVYTGLFNGTGDSRTPFVFNSVGMVINIVLDPLLIFGWGPFPQLGALGAGLATIGAQGIVTLLFVRYFHHPESRLHIHFHRLWKFVSWQHIKRIIQIGFPPALQNALFALFAMGIARILSEWGPTPIAVQKVGSQIESISWLTAGGFASALSAFVGQNYGAQQMHRIQRGYRAAIGIMGVVGLGASGLLIFAAKPIFSQFITESLALEQGIVYLQILGVSQLFMCLEITTAGAFNGLGKTLPPALVSIVFTGLRVPMALLLSQPELLGLSGVWWSISLSSVCKGIVLLIWFALFFAQFCRNWPNIATSSAKLKT